MQLDHPQTAPQSSSKLIPAASTIIYFLLALFVNPFTGAALRNWQGCCLQFSLTITLYLFPFLVLSIAIRTIPWFARHTIFRGILAWGSLGIWCLGAPISFLHAFS